MTSTKTAVEAILGSGQVARWSTRAASLAAPADWLPGETPIVYPRSLEEAAEVLRWAARDRKCVLPIGSGAHLDWGEPFAADLVLSLCNLQRVVEYEPDDLTLVAEAGVTLAALAARTREHQQRLAPDPWPGTGTLGGAVAANRCGMNRLRYGGWRDAVLGTRVLHADGGGTRSGGKVVKNVTGYDLTKLYVGSCGSLVVLGEVNVRLVARPEAVVFVLCEQTGDTEALESTLAALRARRDLQPAAMLGVFGEVHTLAMEKPSFLLRFEGREAAAHSQAQAAASVLHGSVMAAGAGRPIYDALRQLQEPAPGQVVFRLSTLPAEALSLGRRLSRCLAAVPHRVLAQQGVGTVQVQVSPAPASDLAALGATVCELVGPDVNVMLLQGPACVRTAIQARMPAAKLQEATKQIYDPERRLRPVPGGS